MSVEGHLEITISLNMHTLQVERLWKEHTKMYLFTTLDRLIICSEQCCYIEEPCELISAKMDTAVPTQYTFYGNFLLLFLITC
jgi:hypothetical protein